MALSTEELTELKGKLLEEQKRLQAELDRLGKPGDAGFETKFDDIGDAPDENATEVEEYVDDLGVETNLEAQLADVEAALTRMEAGTYGVDENNGKEIALNRLRAYPAARTAL